LDRSCLAFASARKDGLLARSSAAEPLRKRPRHARQADLGRRTPAWICRCGRCAVPASRTATCLSGALPLHRVQRTLGISCKAPILTGLVSFIPLFAGVIRQPTKPVRHRPLSPVRPVNPNPPDTARSEPNWRVGQHPLPAPHALPRPEGEASRAWPAPPRARTGSSQGAEPPRCGEDHAAASQADVGRRTPAWICRCGRCAVPARPTQPAHPGHSRSIASSEHRGSAAKRDSMKKSRP
jgi:hypothetical protein